MFTVINIYSKAKDSYDIACDKITNEGQFNFINS